MARQGARAGGGEPVAAPDYPRVLVVQAAAFTAASATGITMSNLFRGWPVDRIAQVHSDIVEPSQEICRRYWRVSPADVPLDRFVRRLLGKRKEQILGRPSTGLMAGLGTAVAGDPWRRRVVLHGVASAWADLLRLRLSRAFWDWVDEFRPDVIFSILGSIRIMNIVLEIADRLGKPVVPHFMDDWPTTHYRASLWSQIPRRAMWARLRAALRRAPVGMTISDAMAREYQQRYGKRFEAFMNCVEVPDAPLEPPSVTGSSPIRLLYAGGLHLNRWRSLTEIGAALERLSMEGLNAELVVHAPTADLNQYRAKLSERSAIRLGESLALSEIAAALAAADILVHVESFDQSVRDYTRLSISTKIPQYMAAGRPILAYGPVEVASCRYIDEKQAGMAVGTKDEAALTGVLQTLLRSAELRRTLGRNGWQCALENHSAERVREHFRRVVADVAQCEQVRERLT